MSKKLTTSLVWDAIEKELFGVLGMVTAQNEARTVGIVYIVRDRKLYIGTGAQSWKARHAAANPHVSITIPIAKQAPLMPWIKIPAATITFPGLARIMAAEDSPKDVLKAVFRDQADDSARMAEMCVIEVAPEKEFITYGVGVSLLEMRDAQKARGRVPVDGKKSDLGISDG